MNHFEYFGLPEKYDIDEGALTSCYLKMQRKNIGQNTVLVDECTSALNDAYITLRDPIKRAEYLLVLHGYDTNDMPQRIAAEMFDLREEFEQYPVEQRGLFVENLENRLSYLLQTMQKLKSDTDEFFDAFCAAKFINAFLEKIRANDFDRN